ncbi:MAG: mechanosensitive ion channel domain-containing protein [Pseudomonadota bacterium]
MTDLSWTTLLTSQATHKPLTQRKIGCTQGVSAWLPHLLFSLALGFLPLNALAQSTLASTIAELRTVIVDAEAVSDDQRAQLNERLDGALLDETARSKFENETEELRNRVQQSASLIENYDSKLRDVQRAPLTVESRLLEQAGLDEVEIEIATQEQERSRLDLDRTQVLESTASDAASADERRGRLDEISQQLSNLETVASENGSSDLAQRVRTAVQTADRSKLEQERELLRLRQRSAPTLNSIRSARVAWLDAAISDLDAYLVALQQLAAERRKTAASQRKAETRRLLSGLAPQSDELRSIGQQNLKLSQEYEELGYRIENARNEMATLRTLEEGIEEDANLTRRRLGVAGLESELGRIMLTRLENLPDTGAITRGYRQRNERIADLSVDAIDTEQELREVFDANGYLQRTFGDISEWSDEKTRTAILLLEQRKRLLQENLEVKNTLLRLLVDANQTTDSLVRSANNYESFLTANLLWVRDYSFFSPRRLRDQAQTLRSSFSNLRLSEGSLDLIQDPSIITALVVIGLLLFQRSSIKGRMDATLSQPIRPRDESPALLFESLIGTAMLALPLPLLLFVGGRLWAVLESGDVLGSGISVSVAYAAIGLFALDILDRMSGRFGAGRRLLKWNGQRLDLLTRDLGWLKLTVTLAILLIGLGRDTSPTDSGGPLAAIGSALMAASLFIALLRINRTDALQNDGLSQFAVRSAIIACAAILLMHASGQLFAAHLYLNCLLGSILALLGVYLAFNILKRLLMLSQSKLERRERAEQKAFGADGAEPVADEPAVEEPFLDAETLSEAFTNLLRLLRLLTLGTLLWLAWSPALPALDAFDSVTLWTTASPSGVEGEMQAITLGTFLAAALTAGIAILLMQYLPPLANVLLREWTQVTAGARYATSMLMQYVIVGAGLSLTLGTLGFEWSKVQWLVAALGVGIGFGLQEIVANFISGLILLFERPIRVGDIINAGGYDGVVTKINSRATVLQTFEKKEVLIPNKDLITSVVTNWSLSDSQIRVVIPVGVAYGCDVTLAMRLLAETAGEHPDISEDPEPMVSFEDFGDNSLILWLRCYAVADYVRVATELRVTIYDKLNSAGIGISFPQRDIHIDTESPIPVQVMAPDT